MTNKYGLEPKQERFCLYYLISYNATQAYLDAYGSSYRVANVNGTRLLKHPTIKHYLADLKQRQSDMLGMNRQDLLRYCARLAMADIGDYVHIKRVDEWLTDARGNVVYDANNEPVTRISNQMWLEDSDVVDMSLISEIRVNEDGITVKLKDSATAMRILMQCLPESETDAQQTENTFLQALQLSESVFKESNRCNDPK